VLQVASPRALYEAPNCREVADFIGTMNFFEGATQWVEGNTITADAGAAGRLRVANAPEFARKMGAHVLLAVRPEKMALALTGAGTASSENRLSGTLVAAAYLGERSHYQVRVEGMKEPIAVAAQNEGPAPAAHHTGAPVTLTWPSDAMIVLPTE
jgi:spermidine/putrescine transport system ATP-binding protein/putrescine transport system ATP-binding protein